MSKVNYSINLSEDGMLDVNFTLNSNDISVDKVNAFIDTIKENLQVVCDNWENSSDKPITKNSNTESSSAESEDLDEQMTLDELWAQIKDKNLNKVFDDYKCGVADNIADNFVEAYNFYMQNRDEIENKIYDNRKRNGEEEERRRDIDPNEFISALSEYWEAAMNKNHVINEDGIWTDTRKQTH